MYLVHVPGTAAAAVATALLLAFAAPSRAADPILVDSGDEPAAWTAIASPSASARIEAGAGSFALDFDLGRGRSHAIARRDVSLDLPPDYMFVFDLKSDAEPNTIEIKFISGEDVWWRRLADVDLARDYADWKPLRISRARVAFAWGPSGGKLPARHFDAIEIAVVAGKGGKGKLWIDGIRLEPRDPGAGSRPPVATTTSNADGAVALLDGDPATVWSSAKGDRDVAVTLDFHEALEQGGLEIDHVAPSFSESYVVEASLDGTAWEEARHFTKSNGGTDHVFLPDVYSRYLRVRFDVPPHRHVAIGEIRVQPFEYSGSINGFFTAIARAAPPGTYPRYFSGEQSYWTVAGVPGDVDEALINEEGSVEVAAGSFTIEPFLWRDDKLHTWKDAATSVSLADGELPIPTVVRRDGDVSLSVTALASGEPGASTLYLRYRLETHAGPSRVKLFLAVRPFQVLPPWQALNRTGGATSIARIERVGSYVAVDKRRLVTLTGSSTFGAATFEEGDISEFLARGELPASASAIDPFGYASGALAWEVDLRPGTPSDVWIAAQWAEGSPVDGKSVAKLFDAVRDQWRERVARVPIELPEVAADWVASLRSNLAYILINRDGDAIQPGSRTYERSWIRDGAMTSGALLELGLSDEVKGFLRWYARYIGKDGYVPCCVDARGADPVPEHDSFGEFIWAVAEVWRFTRDEAFVREMWPHVHAAAECMSRLRAKRMTPEYKSKGQGAYFGLLPESISHEGYSARPVHSYWDQAFGLRGYIDAAMLASVVGDAASASTLAAERDAFTKDLTESIRMTMSAKKPVVETGGGDLSRNVGVAIEEDRDAVVPASVELADFDPTSTAVSFLLGVEGVYPPDALLRSFDKYVRDLRAREGLETPGVGYTAYELRSATALVLLGRKQEAIDMLGTLVADQRPPEWNQWPEISWLKKTEPQFLGDLPHTWIGSTFVHAVRTLLVAEREGGMPGSGGTTSLLVGAGIPLRWLDSGAVRARALPTWFGPISLEIRAEIPAKDAPGSATVKLEDGASGTDSRHFEAPEGGIEVAAPFGADAESATIDGKPVTLERGIARATRLPATVVFQYKRALEKPR